MDFSGGPVAKTRPLNAGGLGSTPGQGTRSHMLQLKTLGAATKTEDPFCAESKICSQVKLFFVFCFLFFCKKMASFSLKILKNTQGASVSIQDGIKRTSFILLPKSPQRKKKGKI